ncbi:MAG: GNAT family N-acetyltransferase [Chloroflexota bacterium]|nr:GNAT family N-acetyltransferase [Chloroflexota bacterium]
MSSEFTIRHATIADLETLVGFNSAMAWETEDKGLCLETLRRGIGLMLEDASLGFYLVAEFEGKPVAQLMVTTEWSDWRNAHFFWLQSLYVNPDHRRQGIFRRLYETVERLARESGNVCGIRLYVERTNTRAQEAYVNLGMAHSHYDMYEVEF